MGLDITAYAKVTLVRAIDLEDYNKDEGARTLANGGGHCYLFENCDDRPQSDGMPAGIYATSGFFGFDAGSYGGYNAWRDQLAQMMLDMMARQVWEADKGSLAGRPFVELIDFSDCEGFIGPKTCAKLSADFAKNQDKANKSDRRFRDMYANWHKAFAIASEGGAVRFH